MKIDNFAITMFQACPAKFFLRIKQGYTTRRKSAALGFGGAFHSGLAAWYRSGGSRVAMLEAVNNSWPEGLPIDDYRTKVKCVDTLIKYTSVYPAETFRPVTGPEGPMIEVSFTLPTGMYLPCDECWILDGDDRYNPVCENCGGQKEEIEYGGIFDGLVEFSGSVFILEHKTTSQLGPGYFYQFRPNNQVTGYVWGGMGLSGKRVGGAIINAIGVYKSSAPKFERQVTSRSQEEIDEWMNSVYRTCVQIRQCERNHDWPLHTVACTMYGRCEYHQVHSLPFGAQREAILEQDYIQEHWDYEGRDE